MLSGTVLILNAFIAQASDLDGTTLGKPGQVMSQQVKPLVSRSSHLSAPRPRMTHALHAFQVPPLPGQVPLTPQDLGAPVRNKEPSWAEKRAPAGGSTHKEWPQAYDKLLARGLTQVSPQQAFRWAQKGEALIVDVRMDESIWDTIQLGPFSSGTLATAKSGTPEGAVNVPYFRSIEGNSMFDILKKMNAYMFIMEPTERNPNFKELALKTLPKNKKLILTCNRGGDLQHGLHNRDKLGPGRYTSSLKAAHDLYNLGYDKLYIMDGGVREWGEEGLPMIER